MLLTRWLPGYSWMFWGGNQRFRLLHQAGSMRSGTVNKFETDKCVPCGLSSDVPGMAVCAAAAPFACLLADSTSFAAEMGALPVTQISC